MGMKKLNAEEGESPRINFRIPKSLHDGLIRLAKAERLPLSLFLRRLLDDHYEKVELDRKVAKLLGMRQEPFSRYRIYCDKAIKVARKHRLTIRIEDHQDGSASVQAFYAGERYGNDTNFPEEIPICVCKTIVKLLGAE